jgi:Zn-dependent protease with chaperone function
MCRLCIPKASPWSARRAFVLALGAVAAAPVLAQVEVGKSSNFRKLVPAEQIEAAASQQYAQMMAQARAQNALAPDGNGQLQKLRVIAQRIIAHTGQWNDRARQWRWEVNLIGSKQINAFCMPGGKIAFYTGILDQLKLSDDEAAMVMGHEMAHALREHARERLGKTQATSMGLSIGAQLLGLGDLGNVAAKLGTQLLTLKFSRDDESEADLVGMELAARSGFSPLAGSTLWRKMAAASGNKGQMAFMSTHPSGPDRIRELEANAPKVQALFEQARKGG